MTERLFKVLREDGISPYADYKWPPLNEWLKAEGDLVMCANGIHLCREQDLLDWLNAEIYEAEARGERIDGDDKIVVREARLIRRFETWNDKTARLFAADCAERVLPNFEVHFPDDARVRDCIAMSRAFARGEATREQAYSASDSAAYSAAHSAAYSAYSARLAADLASDSAARSARLAAYSAAHSARSAADSAAYSARSAADLAARQWQTTRLFEYLDGTRS